MRSCETPFGAGWAAPGPTRRCRVCVCPPRHRATPCPVSPGSVLPSGLLAALPHALPLPDPRRCLVELRPHQRPLRAGSPTPGVPLPALPCLLPAPHPCQPAPGQEAPVTCPARPGGGLLPVPPPSPRAAGAPCGGTRLAEVSQGMLRSSPCPLRRWGVLGGPRGALRGHRCHHGSALARAQGVSPAGGLREPGSPPGGSPGTAGGPVPPWCSRPRWEDAGAGTVPGKHCLQNKGARVRLLTHRPGSCRGRHPRASDGDTAL